MGRKEIGLSAVFGISGAGRQGRDQSELTHFGSTTEVELLTGKFYGFYAGQGSETVFSLNAANLGGQDRYARKVNDGLESQLTLFGDAFVASILARIVP